MNKLVLAILWREDVASGEMIEGTGYKKDYMVFDEGVTQKELNAICKAANTYYECMDSKLRITDSMGELRPAFCVQRNLPL